MNPFISTSYLLFLFLLPPPPFFLKIKIKNPTQKVPCGTFSPLSSLSPLWKHLSLFSSFSSLSLPWDITIQPSLSRRHRHAPAQPHWHTIEQGCLMQPPLTRHHWARNRRRSRDAPPLFFIHISLVQPPFRSPWIFLESCSKTFPLVPILPSKSHRKIDTLFRITASFWSNGELS